MKVALLTFYTPNFQPLADIIVPNKERYCHIAGYEHIVKIGPYADPKWYYAIDRLKYVQDVLFKTPNAIDIIWVLNLHTYIMNYRKRLETVLTDEHDFFITSSCNGLNAGSFVVRKSEWSMRWLSFVIEKALAGDHCWYEQKVMQDHAGGEGWREKIKILPQNAINSMDYRLYDMPESTEGQFKKGDFVFHAPGIAAWETCSLLEARIKLFTGEWINENLIGQSE
jgi:mannan polymerase II complex MNN10 subunit